MFSRVSLSILENSWLYSLMRPFNTSISYFFLVWISSSSISMLRLLSDKLVIYWEFYSLILSSVFIWFIKSSSTDLYWRVMSEIIFIWVFCCTKTCLSIIISLMRFSFSEALQALASFYSSMYLAWSASFVTMRTALLSSRERAKSPPLFLPFFTTFFLPPIFFFCILKMLKIRNDNSIKNIW